MRWLLRWSQEYGEIYRFRAADQQITFINHPDLVKEVLVTQQTAFRKSRILQRAKVLLGEGLLTSEGEFHTRQRRLVQPAFYQERLAAYASEMVRLGGQSASDWHAGERRDLHQDMMRLTLAIVAKTLFGADVDADAGVVRTALHNVLGQFQISLLPFGDVLQKLPLPQVLRFRKAKAQLDEIIYRIVSERRASAADTGDLLSMLIQSRTEDGEGMSDQQIRDETLTLFLAGHETTANALTWAWYLLSKQPDVEARFHAEIDAVTPSLSELPRLEYTRRVFAEAMRLYPPAWALGRMALRDVVLGGHTIPANSIVLMSPYVMHRTERYWADPLRFDPDRFLPGQEASRPRFSYFPFGGGARVCIGERFAWMEGTILLAVLGKRWRFRTLGDATEQAQITLRPRGGMPVEVMER